MSTAPAVSANTASHVSRGSVTPSAIPTAHPRDGNLSGSRTRQENPCPQSPSFTREAFAHREVARSSDGTLPAKERTFGSVSGFLKFLSNDASLRTPVLRATVSSHSARRVHRDPRSGKAQTKLAASSVLPVPF